VRNSCVRFLLLFAIFLSLSAACLAQRVAVLDTIYTPPGYSEGSLSATVFLPAKPNGAGIVLCHGITATRVQMEIWCDSLAAHGFVAMTIDYYDIIDAAHGRYPKPVRAFKTAVQFFRRRAARFGISPDKIGGIGLSQGSIVWGETIVWDNDHAFFQTDSTIDDRLDAVVMLYGLFDNDHFLTSAASLESWLTQYFSSNPSLRSTKGNCIVNVGNISTPVLMIHGTKDVILQYQQSTQFHDSLNAHGKVSQLQLFAGQAHEFDLNGTEDAFTPIGLVVKDTVVHFFERILGITGTTAVSPGFAARLPADYRLLACYPNPFNSSTMIEYTLPRASHVILSVYDILGRRLAVVTARDESAGTHRVSFAADGLASGFYILRLQTSDLESTLKLMLLK
jgi:dienelactone hydrolase